MISFHVRDINSQVQNIEIPDYINLSLMEVLRAWEYPIAATCKGIAQCATCHVIVIKGMDQLPEAGDREIDTLDLLPDSDYKSRLACQIKANEQINGCLFEIKGSKSLICGPHVVSPQS
ncbi:MAG: (2Fe-2S)-binding protein [Pyrinomonadaceae bacterium]|nr:(2Fe-2S)-binding protein [Sphingobacteriaceae bacterium]